MKSNIWDECENGIIRIAKHVCQHADDCTSESYL